VRGRRRPWGVLGLFGARAARPGRQGDGHVRGRTAATAAAFRPRPSRLVVVLVVGRGAVRLLLVVVRLGAAALLVLALAIRAQRRR